MMWLRVIQWIIWCIENSLPRKVIYGFRFECQDSQPLEAQERERERAFQAKEVASTRILRQR